MIEISAEQHTALKRLIGVARNDSGQSVRIANFLLAWWNSQSMGKWDPADLMGLDTQLVRDIITILPVVARVYPNDIAHPLDAGCGMEHYRLCFEELMLMWRPRRLDAETKADMRAKQLRRPDR